MVIFYDLILLTSLISIAMNRFFLKIEVYFLFFDEKYRSIRPLQSVSLNFAFIISDFLYPRMSLYGQSDY